MFVIFWICGGDGFEPLGENIPEKRELIGVLDVMDQRGECAANECVDCFRIFCR